MEVYRVVCRLNSSPHRKLDVARYQVMGASIKICWFSELSSSLRPPFFRSWAFSSGHCGGLSSSEEEVGKVGSNDLSQMFCFFYCHQRPPPGGGRSQPGTQGLSIRLLSDELSNLLVSMVTDANPQFTCLFVLNLSRAAVIPRWVALCGEGLVKSDVFWKGP